jgi:hypothetical protein
MNRSPSQDVHKPSQGRAEASGQFWLSMPTDPRFIWLVGLSVAIISSFLPWVSCEIKEVDSDTLVHTWEMSLLDLALTGDTLIIILVALFFFGILVWIAKPKSIALSIIALGLLLFSNAKYIMTHIPFYLDPWTIFSVRSIVGVGCLISLAIVLILGLLALENFNVNETKLKDKSKEIDPFTSHYIFRFKRR